MSFTVDTTGFTSMVKSLSKMSGAPLAPVILSETGKILEGCVRRTRTAKAAAIKRSVAFRNRNLWDNAQWPPKRRGDPVISTNKAGTIFFVDNPGRPGFAKGKRVGKKVFYDMSGPFRWSNERWARFQDAMAELKSKKTDLASALRSRGLAANSWWQIARALGIEIKVPGYVRSATPSNGRIFINGRAMKFDEADRFFIEIYNSNPTMLRTDGQQILSQSIQARLNYFNIAMRKGTFDSIKKAASRYPGVFVS